MNQRISVQGLVAASVLLWGGFVFLISIVNRFAPPYGSEFLKLISSLYPGYHGDSSWKSIAIASSYALVDGAIGGYLFAVIYNFFCPSDDGSQTAPNH